MWRSAMLASSGAASPRSHSVPDAQNAHADDGRHAARVVARVVERAPAADADEITASFVPHAGSCARKARPPADQRRVVGALAVRAREQAALVGGYRRSGGRRRSSCARATAPRPARSRATHRGGRAQPVAAREQPHERRAEQHEQASASLRVSAASPITAPSAAARAGVGRSTQPVGEQQARARSAARTATRCAASVEHQERAGRRRASAAATSPTRVARRRAGRAARSRPRSRRRSGTRRPAAP